MTGSEEEADYCLDFLRCGVECGVCGACLVCMHDSLLHLPVSSDPDGGMVNDPEVFACDASLIRTNSIL